MTLLIVWALSFTQPHFVITLKNEDACHELGMEMMRLSIHEPVPYEYHCMESK